MIASPSFSFRTFWRARNLVDLGLQFACFISVLVGAELLFGFADPLLELAERSIGNGAAQLVHRSVGIPLCLLQMEPTFQDPGSVALLGKLLVQP